MTPAITLDGNMSGDAIYEDARFKISQQSLFDKLRGFTYAVSEMRDPHIRQTWKPGKLVEKYEDIPGVENSRRLTISVEHFDWFQTICSRIYRGSSLLIGEYCLVIHFRDVETVISTIHTANGPSDYLEQLPMTSLYSEVVQGEIRGQVVAAEVLGQQISAFVHSNPVQYRQLRNGNVKTPGMLVRLLRFKWWIGIAIAVIFVWLLFLRPAYRINAIESVLRKDRATHDKIVSEMKIVDKVWDSSGSIGRYVQALRQIDLGSCPDDFSIAFRYHIQAWEKYEVIARSIGGFRGFFRSFFGGGHAVISGFDDASEAQNKIQKTWQEVLRIAGKYGASVN
jgi:hypothetical protein